MHKPLRIRAYLQTGVISDQFLPLDAILYYHVVRDKYGSQCVTKSNESNVRDYGGIGMPFKAINRRTDHKYYACSFAVWSDDLSEDSQTYCKRFDLKYSNIVDFKGRVGKISVARDRYKAYNIKIYYRTATYVEWYADGEIDSINTLLPFVTHLGKKTSQGWGQVLKWDVEEWHSDWSVYGFEHKRLMRAIPSVDGGFLYGIRPSYWNPKHQFPCRMPDAK